MDVLSEISGIRRRWLSSLVLLLFLFSFFIIVIDLDFNFTFLYYLSSKLTLF